LIAPELREDQRMFDGSEHFIEASEFSDGVDVVLTD
jgi:hypothetical protein